MTLKNAPAPGPRLLGDDGQPTYAASVEKSTGLPAFWGDADDSRDAMFEPQPSIGERHAIARRARNLCTNEDWDRTVADWVRCDQPATATNASGQRVCADCLLLDDA